RSPAVHPAPAVARFYDGHPVERKGKTPEVLHRLWTVPLDIRRDPCARRGTLSTGGGHRCGDPPHDPTMTGGCDTHQSGSDALRSGPDQGELALLGVRDVADG